MSFDILVQVVLSGLLLGGIYALVAFGLSLVYGVANILNIAHGTFLTISGVWIYGLFRTEWIKRTSPEFGKYSVLGDHIWLYGMLLQEQVVGTDEAIYYRTQTQGKYVLSTRKKVETLLGVLYHIPRLTWTRLPPEERWQGFRRAFSFIYRRQIRQRNFLGTSLRIAKLTTLLTWFGIDAGIRRMLSPFRHAH